MAVIQIRGLKKSYRVYQKQEGLWASLTGLFHREYRDVEAVRGIDLERRRRRVCRVSRTQRRRQDDHAQAAVGCDHPSAGEASVMGHVPWERTTRIAAALPW